MNPFTPVSTGKSFRIRQYLGTGTSSVVESNQFFATKEEAQAAADRANRGDKSGLTFGMYADD